MNPTIRVLYVEDNPHDADLTRSHFEFEAPEFEIEIAENGKTALKLAREREYDALLLDRNLPDMDGIQVLKELAALGVQAPVVIVTGLGDEELVVQALRLGATDYVRKHGDYLATLPTILRRVVAESKKKKASGQAVSLRRRHILYVEQNPADLDLLPRHLAEAAPHLTVTTAQSCGQALQLLSQPHQLDLVLTDLRMPDMPGLDFLREANHQGISLPFIIITGKGDEEAAVAALKLGAYDYIVKRENYLTQLPYAIENALARFQLDQANVRLQTELAALNQSLEQRVKDRTAELEQEIAERKRAEEAVAASQKLLQDITDNGTSLVYALDQQGRFLLISRSLESVLGVPRETLIGKTREAILPPEIAAAHRDNDLQVMNDRQPIAVEEENNESDGKHTYLSMKFPLLDPQGRVYGVGGVSTDITERKRAEEATVQAAQEWQTTFDSTNNAIWILDQEQRVLRSNKTAERLFRRPREEFIGKHCWEIVHGTAQPIPECPILRARNSLRRESMELQIGEGWFEVTVDPILDAAGRYDGAVHIISDITERKRAEAQLTEQLDELRRWHQATLGRETRILDLKREVNELLAQAGQPPRYPSAEIAQHPIGTDNP